MITPIDSMVEYALNRISEALTNNPDRDDILGSLADEIHEGIDIIEANSDDVLKEVRDYLSDLMEEFEINNPFGDYF